MIKENQRLFDTLNVITDGILIYPMLPLAFWLRFYVLPGGEISITLRQYLILGFFFTLSQLFLYAAFGLYQQHRRMRLLRELPRVAGVSLLNLLVMMSWLFISRESNYSRQTLLIFFGLYVLLVALKRVLMRKGLRYLRGKGVNVKRVIVVGSGRQARSYLAEIGADPELGYRAVGYIAPEESQDLELPWLGGFDAMKEVFDRERPDEVVSAVDMADYARTPEIIDACEGSGSKLAIIPIYAEYMSARPQFDDLNGIPLLNLRYIPLDNWLNAFCKRAMDIIGSALILLLSSPVMLICAIGVKLSSPGPVIFKQKRIGLNKKPFMMYKFRSMRVNSRQDVGWTSNEDDRKTKFGSFIRKYSLDEFPQFWNVLKGDMSLVGPRPEVPYYVELFREEVPLYMVKHQVRPGITGWAQVNGFRGDTSIEGRIEHDIFYIEHWTLWLDVKILWMTVFGGKFKNEEVIA